jgi:hypothetical protein
MEIREYKDEELTFEEREKYIRAYEVAKRALKYIFSFLLEYKVEMKTNLRRYSFVEPIEIKVKIFWRDEKIEAEAPFL